MDQRLYSRNWLKYCCDDLSLVENYELAKADNFKGWVIHHRLELVETGAVVNSSKEDLIDWGIYYGRPANELVFIKDSEHRKLHRKYQKQVYNNPELRSAKLSKLAKGRPAWNRKCVKCVETNEIFYSISEASKAKKAIHICSVLLGDRHTAGGYHWVLV